MRPDSATAQPCDSGRALRLAASLQGLGERKIVTDTKCVHEHTRALLPALCVRLCPQTPGAGSLRASSKDTQPGGAGTFPAHVGPLWKMEGHWVREGVVTQPCGPWDSARRLCLPELTPLNPSLVAQPAG